MTDILSSHFGWSRSPLPGVAQQSEQQQQQVLQKTARRMLPRLKNDLSPQGTPRKITLFRNGDRYFAGKQAAIVPQNYSNLGQLLQELSTTVDLPYGVRRLFTPNQGSEVTSVSVIKDGASYVCASFEPFQAIDYKTISVPRLTFNIEQIRNPAHKLNSSHWLNVRHLPTLPNARAVPPSTSPTNSNVASTANRFPANSLLLNPLSPSAATPIQPAQKKALPKPNQSRPITIIKQGNEKPHKTVTIFLNRRTVQTYEQLLSDISESFGYQKNRADKIRRLFTLKGKQVNGINDFFREDDVFVASTNATDVSLTDLHEISIEMLNDPQRSTPRNTGVNRSTFKPNFQPLVDRQTPNPFGGAAATVADAKKMPNVRDSGFLDEEEGLSGRDSELTSSQKTPSRPVNSNGKAHDVASEDAPTPHDLIGRRPKKVAVKPTNALAVEQQRERERQKFKEEEDRRKKLVVRKDNPATGQVLPAVKFEPLAVDVNNDEGPSRRPKTPINGTGTFSPHSPLATGATTKEANKPPSTTPVPRTNKHDENYPGPRDANLPTASAGAVPKGTAPKKRSSVLHTSSSVVTDRFELSKKMGDGNFAVVYRSKLCNSDREYAIKIVDKTKMKGKEYMLDHEINIMYMCDHPNIIRLFEDYETPDQIYLVMELIKGGDLFDYITKHRRFDEPTSSLMIKDVSEALLYLHAKKIVHRDLKPENLLVMQRRGTRITIKLTDFGLAMQVSGPIKTVCGTPTYVAPEILAETGYGIEVDCWAVGIILYILLCGYPPFKSADRNQEVLFQLIQRGKYAYEPEYWSSVSANAKNLIDHLLVVERHKRMRADEILVHPWIMSVGQSKAIRNPEELKAALRSKYDAKVKEYTENQAS